MRQQELALKEKEEALKAEEDREKGILPEKPKSPVVEDEEQKQAEKPGIFNIFKIFSKKEENIESEMN